MHVLERIMIHHVPLSSTTSGDSPIPMPGPVQLSWMSELLPSTFGSELAELRRVISCERDSLGDRGPLVPLVDPSLYCGIVGRTKCHTTPQCDYETPAQQMSALMSSPAKSILTIRPRAYGFRWLPCEIEVDDESGTARIRSYINNLHPVMFADLYHSIERIFTHFVPLFERVLTTLEKPNASDSSELDVDLDLPRRFLHGRQCQVVVRIAEVQLTPDTPATAFRGDEWQCAGSEAEHIIATGMYFYSVQNITTARLAYQRVVAYPSHVPNDDVTLGLVYGLQNEDLLAHPLGHVTALEGRCVVFPNLYESKLEPFRLHDPTQPGSLGTLTLMLVAPMATPVCSTASVPPQQSHWLQRERDPLLRQLNLPETIETLVREFSLEGMTREEATRHRDQLEQYRLWPREDSDYLWFHKERNYLHRYYM